ncbi:metallophosphoesterase family protein [Virgibacillus xinjiangensis]|uniref:Phosphoesterase n=1 Tax=Virgibacillus xinjiangensis TaxID=393090 RepID=A0ABV7CU94_9BACI
MTKVLILSDSHGLTKELKEIKKRHTVDYMIHCGDSELEMDATELEGFYMVGGNMDMDHRFPDEQTVTIGGLTFFIAHGHLHNVKGNISTIAYRAEEEGAQVICFGHTHIAGAEKLGAQLLINPGSIRLPRNRQEKTYAIMEWNSKDDIKVNFYTETGEIVPDMAYSTML